MVLVHSQRYSLEYLLGHQWSLCFGGNADGVHSLNRGTRLGNLPFLLHNIQTPQIVNM